MTENQMQLIVPVVTVCVVLGTFLQACVLMKRPHTSFHKIIGVLLCFEALSLLADGIGLVDDRRYLLWRRIAFSGELLLPGLFAFVVVSFLKDPPGHNMRSPWHVRAWAYVCLGLGLLGYLWWKDASYVWTNRLLGETEILISPAWQICYVFVLLGMTVALSQFEQIHRLLKDSERYRSKMCLIGLGSIAFYEIYQTSQVLLDPAIQHHQVLLRSLTTGFGVVLIVFGWRRSRYQEALGSVKVSAELAYGSASIILIGAYLVILGSVWYWVKNSDLPGRSLLAGSIGFLAILAFVIVALSRSWQIRARQFLAKHVIRSKHDYRAKWLEVTDSFSKTRSTDEILDSLLVVLARTFSTGLISIWMLYDSDKRLHRTRTINSQGPCEPLGTDNVLIARLQEIDEPANLHSVSLNTSIDASLQRFLMVTQAELCVPIKVQEQLVAMMVLGSQEGKGAYEFDDIELLRMIAHHVGVLLSHARMAEDAAASAELEAFHRFSAFCMHDIKNLAARLSLVVQNAELHGKNPDFQRTAMQAVSRTVDRMMTLMSKLGSQTREKSVFEDVDVRAVIQECLQSDALKMRVVVNSAENLYAAIRADHMEVFQLILNLLLNAQQAGASEADLTMERGQKAGDLLLRITDNGSGVSEEQLRTIFQPLRTTKRQGLGVGLFQCRQIVERYGGSIRIESKGVEGTCVLLSFPLADILPQRETDSGSLTATSIDL